MANQAVQTPIQDLLKADIFELLDMAGVSSKQRQEISTDMVITIQNRITSRLQDSLAFHDQDALIVALSEGRADEARAILSDSNLPSLETMAVEEALIYKHQFINE
ncbi:MAG: hypothetical protein AAB400_03560 [Patescibacteria group bacterium]